MSHKNLQPGTICWNELLTTDAKKALEFYGQLFGWTTQAHEMEHMTYHLLKMGDKDIGGMMQIPADKKAQIPPHWATYINVENLDEMIKKAQKLGAILIVPATDVQDYGRFAVIQDPTGAHISFWQALKTC